MNTQTCWRCISRASESFFFPRRSPNQQQLLLPSSRAAFTTSAYLSALPPKAKSSKNKQNARDNAARGNVQTFRKKKTKHQPIDRSRRPAVGERKALRKRIVLSNTNALEVNGLQDLSADSFTDNDLRGQVLGIPGPLLDRLRAVEAFKVKQGWALFRRPAMLMRKISLDLGKELEEISEEGSKKSIRRVYVGEKGSGKSAMLLQAMTMAFMKHWIVISIPDAQDLVLGHTEYTPIPGTSPTQYAQPTYTASLFGAIIQANPILQTLQLSESAFSSAPNIPILIPPNITLSRLAQLGAQDPETAWPIFQLLYRELLLPGRPPLMLCLDGLAHAMTNTHYLSGITYQPIHAHDFALISHFFAHFSSTTPLTNGGAVLAATSESNQPIIPSLSLALSQLEEGKPVQRDPYVAYDERVLAIFEKGGVEVQRLGGLEKAEARGLMEYWARSGVVRQRIDEGFVGEKWSLSGGGCVGELERAVVRMRF